MAEMLTTGSRVSFAPLGSSEWTEIPTASLRWSGSLVEDAREQYLFDLRSVAAGASMSFDLAMKRRDIRRMIRMFHIRRSRAAVRQSAMHSAYHRRQKRRRRS